MKLRPEDHSAEPRLFASAARRVLAGPLPLLCLRPCRPVSDASACAEEAGLTQQQSRAARGQEVKLCIALTTPSWMAPIVRV